MKVLAELSIFNRMFKRRIVNEIMNEIVNEKSHGGRDKEKTIYFKGKRSMLDRNLFHILLAIVNSYLNWTDICCNNYVS